MKKLFTILTELRKKYLRSIQMIKKIIEKDSFRLNF